MAASSMSLQPTRRASSGVMRILSVPTVSTTSCLPSPSSETLRSPNLCSSILSVISIVVSIALPLRAMP